jgi:hypothetical protein
LRKRLKGKIGSQDPGILFNWSSDLAMAIQVINGTQPPLPTWSNLTYPVNIHQFKDEILRFCQAGTTAGAIIHSCVIAPNSLGEYGRILYELGHLNSDGFLVQVANAATGPLARVLYFTDRAARVTCFSVDLGRPPSLQPNDFQPFV